MLKWYQEPLVHFLLLGSLLYFIMQTDTFFISNKNSHTITIDNNKIKKLISYWEKKYQIPPTQKELNALLDIYIENEILYNEALSMKLDKHDDSVKQLLVNKLKYIVSDPIDITKISEKHLETFFNENKNLFLNHAKETFTFAHIYLNPKENESINKKAQTIYTSIKNRDMNISYTKLGDTFYKGSYFKEISKKELSKIFSYSFLQELHTLPKRTWTKPINSGYGMHLIYLEDIHKNKITFHDIKEEVKNKYIIQMSKQNYKNYYKKVKEKYNISIAPYTLKSEK